MIKYYNYDIVMEEIPNKLSLAINITNCQNRCVGCHSPHLRLNIGEVLNKDEIDKIIENNFGINCVIFMGEGNDINKLIDIAIHVKNEHNIPIALYSGSNKIDDKYLTVFDYIKIGEYMPERGPLNNKNTNQILYRIEEHKGTPKLFDITNCFCK